MNRVGVGASAAQGFCTSTYLPQNHVSRLLPWGAKVRLFTEYLVREVVLVLYLHYYTYVHYEVRPM